MGSEVYLFGLIANEHDGRYKVFNVRLPSSDVPLPRVRILVAERLGLDPNTPHADQLQIWRLDEQVADDDERLVTSTTDPTSVFTLTAWPDSFRSIGSWIPKLENTTIHVLVKIAHERRMEAYPAQVAVLDALPPAYTFPMERRDHPKLLEAGNGTPASLRAAQDPSLSHTVPTYDTIMSSLEGPGSASQRPQIVDVDVAGKAGKGGITKEGSDGVPFLRRRNVLLLLLLLVLLVVVGAVIGVVVSKKRSDAQEPYPPPTPWPSVATAVPTPTTTAATATRAVITWITLPSIAPVTPDLLRVPFVPSSTACEASCQNQTSPPCNAAVYVPLDQTCHLKTSLNMTGATTDSDSTVIVPLNTSYATSMWTMTNNTDISAGGQNDLFCMSGQTVDGCASLCESLAPTCNTFNYCNVLGPMSCGFSDPRTRCCLKSIVSGTALPAYSQNYTLWQNNR